VIGAAVAVLLTIDSTDSKDPRNITATNPPTTAPIPTPTPTTFTCGTTLPLELSVPAGYAGPITGPAPAADQPVEPGQFVQHWTSGATTFETRWPGLGSPFAVPGGTPGSVSGASSLGSRTASGTPFGRAYYAFGGQPADCYVLQVSIYGVDDTTVATEMEAFWRRPFDVPEVPLVAQTVTVDQAPAARPCQTPPGVLSPNEGGAVTSEVTHPTSVDALIAFLATRPQSTLRGFIEMHLPDSDVVYAMPTPNLEDDDAYVTVIHVRHDSDGWRVDSWDQSGC
jgi:hypothetical protein